MESIGEKIRSIRKSKGISQTAVADSCSIKQSSYANIENGKTQNITIEIGKGISKALDIPFNELFDIEATQQNQDQIESLKEQIEKLKNDLQIQTSLLSAFEMLQDNKIANRKELKYLREKVDLLNTFQLLDNNLFLKYNQQFATSISLISTFDIACVEKFHKYYGSKASKEIMKYIDIEKYKNSSTFDFLSSFWEGDETWSKEQIIEWVKQQRKELT